jgi:hypothetical protein
MSHSPRCVGLFGCVLTVFFLVAMASLNLKFEI